MSDRSGPFRTTATRPVLGVRGLLVSLGIATLLAAIQASQFILGAASFGRTVPWKAVVPGVLAESWLWAFLVPLVFAVSRRFPLHPGRWMSSIAAHVVVALLVAAVYSTALATVGTLLPDRYHFLFSKGVRPPPPEGPRDGSREGLSNPPPDRRPPDEPWGRRRPIPTFPERVRLTLLTGIHFHLATYAVIVGVWHWLAQQGRLRERERQAQELSRQLAEARLQALRMQLNPHFLFNTLNAIATLVHRDARTADEMIACLSDFLRLTLNAPNASEVPLQKELEFARCYLDIEKVRFGDRLVILEDIAPNCLNIAVPALVLQPLLENAIRHGIERQPERGEIRLDARRDGDRMLLRVADTGPGLAPRPESRPGIGLANTRARLRELHGDLASLEFVEAETGGLRVEVRLPWRSLSDPAESLPA